MPELKCTVQTCVHNKQFLCDLDAIQVGGSDAKHPRETCCDSFQERKDGVYQNAYSDVTGKASDTSRLTVRRWSANIMKTATATPERSV